MMYSNLAAAVLILCVPFGAFIGYLLARGWIKLRRYKKDQGLRELVRKLVDESREKRKHLMECPDCLGGKTWCPRILDGTFSLDSEDPMLVDCQRCEGEGFIPRPNLH